MAGTFTPPSAGEKRTTGDKKAREGLEGFNNLLDGSNKIPGTSLAAAAAISNAQLAGSITTEKLSQAKLVWYTPKIIATEESRTNVAFGTLTTADEIKEVVVPTNGLLHIAYSANMKSSVGAAGRAAIFVGANQLKSDAGGEGPSVNEAATVTTIFTKLNTYQLGLISRASGAGWEGAVTTGEALALQSTNGQGGAVVVFLAAGTYNISIQYKASSGSVTAKERKLWAYTLGA